STVSKMIKRLKQLGWVTNDEVDPSDRRTRIVRLTELGYRRIRKAMRVVLQQHVFRRWFKAFFANLSGDLVVHVDFVRSAVDDIARGFGDRSELHYDDGTEAFDH